MRKKISAEIGGSWLLKTKKGKSYLSSRISNSGVRLLKQLTRYGTDACIVHFINPFKKNKKAPDYRIFVEYFAEVGK